MTRYFLSALLVGVFVLAACGPAVSAPPTDTPASAATPTPGDSARDTPSLAPTSSSDTVFSNDRTPPAPVSYAPQPGDDKLMRGQVFVDESEVLVLESFPVQIRLYIAGSLPTPCHQLRVTVAAPDAQNRIAVEVYSLVATDLACIQVLSPFEVSIPLDGYTPGETYTVLLNGTPVGEFTP